MTDTHSHPYTDAFPDGGNEAMLRAIEAGVSHVILPGVDASSIQPIKELHARFPENTSMAIGLHPTEIGEDWEEFLNLMERELVSGEYCAVGECGIDLYWNKENLDLQKTVFKRQLEMAKRFRLPVIIHSRDAREETLECIEATGVKDNLVFHSFTGNPGDVVRIREVCDPYFGINGVVTFKNAQGVRDALPEIGLQRMLLETDAPWLSPVPHRGKRNEPAHTVLVCSKIAETLGIPESEVEAATDGNAASVFRSFSR